MDNNYTFKCDYSNGKYTCSKTNETQKLRDVYTTSDTDSFDNSNPDQLNLNPHGGKKTTKNKLKNKSLRQKKTKSLRQKKTKSLRQKKTKSLRQKKTKSLRQKNN